MPDIYISYLFTVPFIDVFLILHVHRRLKFRNILTCSSNILLINWLLVNFTKVMKYKTQMYNICQIIEVNVNISPKATKSNFQFTKCTLCNHSSQWKSGYAGFPKIQVGTGGSHSKIIFAAICHNTSKHCIQFRIWKYSSIIYASWPFYQHVNKQ